MTWYVSMWFMALPKPESAHGMFVSVVYGAIPFLLNFYMQNGVQWTPPTSYMPRPGRPDFVDDR